MHKYLLAGVSAVALVVSAGAYAQDLKYPKGEGAFSWDALQEFADSHKGLEGQKVTVWGPWREGGDQTSAVSYACTRQGPAQWYPLPATQIGVFDETEQVETGENCPSGFDCGIEILIPNEAQRVRVSSTGGILTPFSFGWVYLNLQWGPLPAYGDNFAQMWLSTEMDANGRFSVGFSGVQLDNANNPTTTLIPFP